MNRGEGTPPATKSGRKVKRPAHFDDSPDAKEVASPGKRKDVAVVATSEVKKSARKTLVLASAGTPPPAVKNGSEEPVAKKSARKTLASSREESPEPEPVKKAVASSARKTLLKSAVKNSSAEGTPKKTPAKKVQEAEEEAPAGPGLSRTGRKIKVPAHLKEFEDVVATSRKSVAPSEVEEKPAPKTPGRAKEVQEPKSQVRAKSVVRQLAVEHETEVEEKPTAKTPARARSVARKTAEEDEQPAPAAKTPGRSKSMARKPSVDEEKPVPKTYGRARSMAPQSEEAPPKTPSRARSVARKFVEDEEELAESALKAPIRAKSMTRKASVNEPAPVAPKTPSRRTKSVAPQVKPSEDEDPLALPEEPAKREPSPVKKPPAKTPSKRAKSPEPPQPSESGEPTSRSGRKIKPKKYFGDFEQEEPLPTVAAPAPTPTPAAKVVPASPVKSSPVRSPAKQQIVKKGSPYAPKKDSSPVKRLSVPSQQPTAAPAPVPVKKAKQNDNADGSPFKISPATEERQITKRNINDHHHSKPTKSPVAIPPAAVSPPKKAKLVDSPKPSTSEPELIAERDPLAASSSSESSPPAEDKPPTKRAAGGRKTLPAGSEPEVAAPKAPKTPSRKTMAAPPVAAVAEEPAGSSRSGRKIKPKKFFGDDEAEPTTAAAPVAKATPGAGRKRKTLAAAVESPEEPVKEDKKKDEEVEAVSREEIMAIVGDFQEEAEAAVAAVEEKEQGVEEKQQQQQQTELINGSSDDKSDAPTVDINEAVDDETSTESNEPEPAVIATIVPEPEQAEREDQDQQQPEQTVNFPETRIEQTPPLATPAVPDDPVPSAEEVEAVEAPAPLEPTEEEPASNNVAEIAEASASSNFSEALLVEEEPTVEEKMEELFESVEFLEDSALAGRLSAAAEAAVVPENVPAELLEATPEEQPVQQEEPVQPVAEPEPVPEPEPVAIEEEDLDKTEPPATLDEPTFESEIPEEDDLNKTEPPVTLDGTAEDVVSGEDLLASAIPEGIDEYFAENDRDQESITVFPETPKAKPDALDQEEIDLIGKLPEPQQSSNNTVALVEIPDTPVASVMTPKTPESKPSAIIAKDDYSPDKPDAQEQPNVPAVEVIEILDSPVVTALAPPSTQGTSTPLGVATVAKLQMQNNRKRSLSASDADLSTKKNVTFHSPANSTILVDTLDERIKKSLKVDGKTKNARKRSMSEHKELGPASSTGDGPKPSKISKLPDFSKIHQNQFSRMESIAEYHNRKAQRAKDILTNSASKSPAAALVRSGTPQKDRPQPTGPKPAVATQLKFTASKPPSHPVASATAASVSAATTKVKPLTDEARQEKRQLQFKAAFKPKTTATATGNGSAAHARTPTTPGKADSPDGTRRVVEQSRHKQHQILKGVRTNKRFELLMKFRDAAHD